jgi:N-acetylmuramic acid 6-phosphate etherase
VPFPSADDSADDGPDGGLSARLASRLAGLTTEAARPDLADLDLLPTLEIARLMNAGDAAVPAAVASVLPAVAAVVDAVVERMARGGRLVYAGAGTAGRLGVLDASECPPTFGTDPGQVVGLLAGGQAALVASVEGAEDDAGAAVADLDALSIGPDDSVIGVSASGRTPYAVAAVRHARALGAFTAGLACNAGSELAAAAEQALEVVVGPELIAGSTRLKAGTAQKLVLNTVSTVAMVRLGKTYGNLMVDVRATNAKLRARAHRLVAQATGAGDREVAAALEATGGEAKNAILCLLADLDATTADRLLTAHGGRLRDALRGARN